MFLGPTHGLDLGQVSAYVYACMGSAFLSLLGTLLVLVSICFKEHASVPWRQRSIVISLTVADLFGSAAVLLSGILWHVGYQDGLWCEALGVGSHFFFTATFFWTSAFAVNVFRELANLNSRGTAVKLFVRASVASWGIPAVLTAVMATFDRHYQNSGSNGHPQMATSWCIPFQGGTAIRILTFYPPLVVLLIFNMVVLYLAYGKLKSNFERTGSFTGKTHASLQSARNMMFLYVGIFMSCWLPSLVDGVLHLFADHTTTALFVVLLSQAVMNPLQGFLNAGVYGLRTVVEVSCLCCGDGRSLSASQRRGGGRSGGGGCRCLGGSCRRRASDPHGDYEDIPRRQGAGRCRL